MFGYGMKILIFRAGLLFQSTPARDLRVDRTRREVSHGPSTESVLKPARYIHNHKSGGGTAVSTETAFLVFWRKTAFFIAGK
jgi:hypothetical protein